MQLKKYFFILPLLWGISLNSQAETTGFYLGGGLGYGRQELSFKDTSNTQGTPTIKVFGGYQLADWIGAELGYTYITQGQNWNNLGKSSTTIYDIAFTPGLSMPFLPITIYARVGIDATSSNLNSNWYNQLASDMNTNFEWGAGIKINVVGTNAFVRAEYINYGGVTNNNNSNLNNNVSVALINAAYVF